MSDEYEEAPIPMGDDTPSFTKQARDKGWKADLFNFGKAEEGDYDFFNPGIVRRPDGLWLLVRASERVSNIPVGQNRIWACELEGDLKPKGGPMLTFVESDGDEHFEDPRAIQWNGQTWVSCVNFKWFEDHSWTGAHQMLGIFVDQTGQPQHVGRDPGEAKWVCLGRKDPPVETNKGEPGDTDGKHNKNWVFFFHDGKLHLIYTSQPWHVIEFGSHWEDQIHHQYEGVTWPYGTIRGGTPPIQVGDHFYTFFHSSMPWQGRYRRYHMGCLQFEAKPPFKPVKWTMTPLLSGSQNDPWAQRKPLVVFPCGALFENEEWLVTMGINDLKSGWVRIPHEDIFKVIEAKPIAPAMSLFNEKTEKKVFAATVPIGEEVREFVESIKPGVGVGFNDPEVAELEEQEEPPDRIYKPEELKAPVEFKSVQTGQRQVIVPGQGANVYLKKPGKKSAKKSAPKK